MKKGQKVRVLADGRVGVVADSHFVMWRGKKLVTCQVKFPDTKGEAPWFPAEKLTTKLVEETSVIITGEKGCIVFDIFKQSRKRYFKLSNDGVSGKPERT